MAGLTDTLAGWWKKTGARLFGEWDEEEVAWVRERLQGLLWRNLCLCMIPLI